MNKHSASVNNKAGDEMKDQRRENAPAGFYIAVTENERAINDFATAGVSGQQMLLAKMQDDKAEKERKRE